MVHGATFESPYGFVKIVTSKGPKWFCNKGKLSAGPYATKWLAKRQGPRDILKVETAAAQEDIAEPDAL